MVSVAAAHILDPLCYILSDFKSLNATTAITFPTMQFVGADGKKDPPIERKFADWISVQGALEGGIMANSVISFTTDATPDRLEWIISGEKGSLKFDGPSVLIGYGQPTLYQFTPGQGAMWEEVKVDSAMFGGIGEVYAAYADGKEGFVDFEGAVQRHKMVEAIYRSAEKGTRESY